MYLSVLPGFNGYLLVPFLLLLSNAFNDSCRWFASTRSCTSSIDVYFSHYLSISVYLSWPLIFIISSFSISILIGLWSEMISSWPSSSIFIHSFFMSFVMMMSMLVFYYLAPAPFLVHYSISYIVQFYLYVSFFHFLYLELLTSVLISIYTIWGIRYCILNSLSSFSILFHLVSFIPLSAWIPASIHLVLFAFIIISVTFLWSLKSSLAGRWL